MRILHTIAAAIAFSAPIAAHAADISVRGDVLSFHGYITMGDALRFRMNLTSADNAGAPVQIVRLDSPGGLVNEAEQIARDVQQRGLNTTVVASGMCASACFLPFAAGKAKIVEDYARVGVHSASNGGQDSDDGTVAMALFATGLGVPDRITARMVAQSGQEMAWLSVAELRIMGASVDKVTVLNDWQLQGTERYDAKAGEALRVQHSGEALIEEHSKGSAAFNDFEASPLYSAIMGAKPSDDDPNVIVGKYMAAQHPQN